MSLSLLLLLWPLLSFFFDDGAADVVVGDCADDIWCSCLVRSVVDGLLFALPRCCDKISQEFSTSDDVMRRLTIFGRSCRARSRFTTNEFQL